MTSASSQAAPAAPSTSTDLRRFAVLALAEIWAASWLAPVIGLNMIKERSHGVSLKESTLHWGSNLDSLISTHAFVGGAAMRTNLTTQGLIAALFLTVMYGLLQAEPPSMSTDGESDPSSLISQWYMLLCLLSLALTMIGTLATVLLVRCAHAQTPPGTPYCVPSHKGYLPCPSRAVTSAAAVHRAAR